MRPPGDFFGEHFSLGIVTVGSVAVEQRRVFRDDSGASGMTVVVYQRRARQDEAFDARRTTGGQEIGRPLNSRLLELLPRSPIAHVSGQVVDDLTTLSGSLQRFRIRHVARNDFDLIPCPILRSRRIAGDDANSATGGKEAVDEMAAEKACGAGDERLDGGESGDVSHGTGSSGECVDGSRSEYTSCRGSVDEDAEGELAMNESRGVFRVKICGVTTAADARVVADSGADAIGFNFYSRSARGVACEQAAQMASNLGPGVARVGVFVNHSAEEIRECRRRVGLDFVQLHGDEPPEMAEELVGLPVVRALRCRRDEWERGATWVEAFVGAGGTLAALLVDAYDPMEYGGTGRRADGGVVASFRARFPLVPLILAGGLTPENVAQVIAEVRPDGVDTASGVELRPGVKSADKVREFVRRALAALQG